MAAATADTALSPNRTYNYRLHVLNSSVESGYSNIVSVDNVPVCARPVALVLSTGTSSNISDYSLSWSLHSMGPFVPAIDGYNIYVDDDTVPVYFGGAARTVNLGDARFGGRLAFGLHTLKIQTVHAGNLTSDTSSAFYIGRDPVVIPSGGFTVQHDSEMNLTTCFMTVKNEDGRARAVTVEWLEAAYNEDGGIYGVEQKSEVIEFAEGQTERTIVRSVPSHGAAQIRLAMPRLVLTNEVVPAPAHISTPEKHAFRLRQDADSILYTQTTRISGWIESAFPAKIIVEQGADCVDLQWRSQGSGGGWSYFAPANMVLGAGQQVSLVPKKPGKVVVRLAINTSMVEGVENWQGVPGTATTVVVLPQHMLESVAFDPAGEGYLDIWSDDSGAFTDTVPSAMVNKPPQWVGNKANGRLDGTPSKNQSIAYIRGASPRISAKFRIPGLAPGQLDNVKLRVSRRYVPDGEVYEAIINHVEIPNGAPAAGELKETPVFTLPQGIPSDSVRYYDKEESTTAYPRENPQYKLVWSVDVGDGVWRTAGTTLHTVYVTLASPVTHEYIKYRQESLFWISCKAAHGQNNIDDTRSYIYSKFMTRQVHRLRDRANPMTFWQEGQSNRARVLEDLLADENGNGDCAAWSSLFRAMLHLHSIQAQRKLLTPKYSDKAFLFKNWKYENTQSTGNAAYPYLENTDVFKIAGKQTQGRNGEDGRVFESHYIVVSDNYQYDPSYGTLPTRGSGINVQDKLYEDCSIDGFGIYDGEILHVRKNDTSDRSGSDINSNTTF